MLMFMSGRMIEVDIRALRVNGITLRSDSLRRISSSIPSQPELTRIVLIQMSFYRFDNSYMLDSMRAHPGVFSGVGIVDDAGSKPERDNGRVGSARRARIPNRSAGASARDWLDTPGMGAMWSTAAKKKLGDVSADRPGCTARHRPHVHESIPTLR